METRVKDGNYYVVQSFMIKELGLKGLEKDVYAIIYGFSQAENQTFKGSLQYLADWTNSTKQGILKTLNSLINKGLIDRKDCIVNNVKLVEYYTTEFNGGVKLSLMGGGKQSLTNNINILDKDIYKDKYIYIVDLLNEKAETHYKSTTPKTRTLIKARLSEGFDVIDFEKVIKNMCSEWKGTEMEQYLRPETLFGTKFESYLNRNVKKTVGKSGYTREELDEIDRRCGTYV